MTNKNKKELYASGEPGLSYDPLEVDEGWEPPYRNKNACLEQKLAKEIGEMSDEAVEETKTKANRKKILSDPDQLVRQVRLMKDFVITLFPAEIF